MQQVTNQTKTHRHNREYENDPGLKMKQEWKYNDDLEAVLEKLGKFYKVDGLLGEGGYSKIYKVHHTLFSDARILKIMDSEFIIQKLEHKDFKNSEYKYNEIKNRFLNEARLYSKIKHDNIVKIIDVSDVKNKNNLDVPFLIMPYTKGISLADLIYKEKRLDFDTALKISRQILSALETLHRARIIHRDIKPGNIIIDDISEQAVLIDFGLAKQKLDETDAEQDDSFSGSKSSPFFKKVTNTDISMGTRQYMSPEQYLGIKNLGSATDIYSFGVVLYEMLSGQVPYMHAQSRQPPPDIEKINPLLPGGIQNILEKAMAKKPGDRYTRAREFLEDLEKLKPGREPDKPAGETITPALQVKSIHEPDQPREPIKLPGKRFLITGIIGIILIAAIIGGYLFIKSKAPGNRYAQLIDTANQSIEKGLYEKARGLLTDALEIKETPEVRWLLETVANKQRENMSKAYRELQDILATGTPIQEKIGKCREFLNRNQNVPPNAQTRKMVSVITRQIGRLEKESKVGEQNRLQIDKMKEDYEKLRGVLKGSAPGETKIGQSRAFLETYKQLPSSSETDGMRSEIQRSLAGLEAGMQAETDKENQYRANIKSVMVYINAGDYSTAAEFLQKARQIKDTPEVKQIETKILEDEIKNGTRTYSAIKDSINLKKYLEFKVQYPGSSHLPDMKNRLKAAEPVLPPEQYWNKPIKKNTKGYYEIRFGPGHNGHTMIYIPGKNFLIDKYEVSNLQYRNYLKAVNRKPTTPIGGDEYPAVVEYEEAESYCSKYGFRLPTESEWEYAASGGQNIAYPWGNESPDENGIYRANFDSFDDGNKDIAPVKSYERYSSPFGLVNMAGNVWEWIQGKKLKGGSFYSKIEYLKIEKSISDKNTPSATIGFRCLKKEAGD